jgi:hypothetical protein
VKKSGNGKKRKKRKKTGKKTGKKKDSKDFDLALF